MSMKFKFAIIYAVMLCCIFIVGIVSSVAFQSISADIDSMIETNYKSIQAVDEMLEIVDRQDSAVLMYLSVDKTNGISIFTEGMQNFLNWYYNLDADTPGLSSIRTNYDAYSKGFSYLQEEVSKNGMNAGYDYYTKQLSPLFNQLKQDIRTIRDDNITQMLNRKEVATEHARSQSVSIFLLTLLTAFAAYLFVSFQVNQMLRPLTVISGRLKNISKGNFDQQLNIHRADEIGVIAEEFNHMAQMLKEYDSINLSKLLSEKNKLETLINNIENPFFIIDSQFMVELENPAAEQFSASETALTGKKHILEVFKEKDILAFIKDLSISNENRMEKIFAFPQLQKTFHAIATKISENENQKYTLLLQDVTLMKETEKIRTDFIATVSHELKTPLTSILMGANILSSSSPENGQKEIIDAIGDDVNRLSKLIDELLELSKMQSGSFTYQLLPESVYEISQYSVSQFTDMAGYHQVDLINEISEDLPLVKADFEKLSLVFNNILNNAFKYTSKGDTIRLEAALEDDFIHIRISDTGLGIKEEDLKNLFQSDFKHNDNNIETRGSGLGLYLSGQIIKAHSGNIRAESKPGNGSTFIFTIPVFKEALDI